MRIHGECALEQQLTQGLRFHQQVTDFMVQRGWYQPYNIQQMITSDIQQAQQMQSMSQNVQNQSSQSYRQ